jgi:hypothetical protein
MTDLTQSSQLCSPPAGRPMLEGDHIGGSRATMVTSDYHQT